MSQAIVTKYIGPTNLKGTRIRVKCQAKSVLIPWNHALGIEDNHTLAAQTVAESLGWLEKRALAGGALPDGSGYAFVLLPKGAL